MPISIPEFHQRTDETVFLTDAEAQLVLLDIPSEIETAHPGSPFLSLSYSYSSSSSYFIPFPFHSISIPFYIILPLTRNHLSRIGVTLAIRGITKVPFKVSILEFSFPSLPIQKPISPLPVLEVSYPLFLLH